jgi:hypothetical protein
MCIWIVFVLEAADPRHDTCKNKYACHATFIGKCQNLSIE